MFSAVLLSSADVGYSWKSYLKSTMGKSRIHGLAQMSIVIIFPLSQKVMDELAKKKRRVNFIL